MAKYVNLQLTPRQLRRLMDLVFVGNVVIGSGDENAQAQAEYDNVESVVFSHAKDINREQFAEYDPENGTYAPSYEFENGTKILEKFKGYDDATFWEELVHRLAMNDVALNVDLTDPTLAMEAILDRSDEYAEFFENHGLEAISVKGMSPINKDVTKFRSAIVGAPEASDVDDDDECHCHDEGCHCHDSECHCHDEDCHCHDKSGIGH